MEIRIRKIAILPHVRSNLARLIIHPLNQIKYPVNDKCSLDIYITTIYEFKKNGGGVVFPRAIIPIQCMDFFRLTGDLFYVYISSLHINFSYFIFT